MMLKRRLVRVGNRFGVWLYRAFDGRLSSGKNATVLVVTAPGRQTGIPRSTCVRYLDTADGFVVWGTAGGSAQDPDWFRNLRVANLAEVQVRARKLQVQPREMVDRERDAVWHDVVLARAPEVMKYARRTQRTIPVAILQPVGEDQPRSSE